MMSAQAPARRATRSTASPARVNRTFDRLRDAYGRDARSPRCACGRRSTPPGSADACSRVIFLKMSDVGRRSWRRPRTRASSSASSTRPPTRPSIRPPRSPTRPSNSSSELPESEVHLPDHLSRQRLWRHGPQALGPAEANRLRNSCPRCRQKLGTIPGIQMFPIMPPALPGGGKFPVEIRDCSRPRSRSEMLGFAKQLQAKAMESEQFCFPADHRYEDRPAAG